MVPCSAKSSSSATPSTAAPGESNPKAALSYPCATEHEGKLYIGFSNNGGRGGNHNSAEMAVIPIERFTS
jgi:hypothetical protein